MPHQLTVPLMAPRIIGGSIAWLILLSPALAEGLAVGVAYGIWAAVDVAATAVLAPAFSKNR